MSETKKKIEKGAMTVTEWVGSVESIVAHTLVFAASFAAVWLNVLAFDRMLLILTTVVSLEAIYLAIFIQMTVNQQSVSLEEVEHDIDEIQEDIDELQEDVEEMSEEERAEALRDAADTKTLAEIKDNLRKLADIVETLQTKR